MRNALPVIAEHADLLKQRLQQERDGRQQPRLQMLYWLASGPAQTRLAGAQLVGVHRHTISHWRRRYAGGGLEALLHRHIPAGKRLSLPPEGLAAIEQALRQPAGVASYAALRHWGQQTYHLAGNDHTRSTIVRTRFKAKLQVPRPSHTKTPDAIPAFQASCGERLQEVLPPATTRPVRGFSQDDSRVGLLPVRRRRLTASGVQPVGLIQPTFAWFDIYGAVAPTTGERFFLALPYLHADTCPRCVDAFAQAFPDRCTILRLENSGAHTAQRMRWPAHGQPVWLPPDCPELNPIERVWRDVKDDLAWQPFGDLAAPQVSVGDV